MKTNRRSFLKQSAALGASFSMAGIKSTDKSNQNTMTDIFEVIKNRRSVRKFKSTPVPDDHLKKILEAANYAPTPRNRQAWKFVVVRDRKILDNIKEECIKAAGENSRKYFTDYLSAPVYISVHADKNTRNPVNDITAGALAVENLMLAARALGYGTVYCVNSINEKITDNILNVPDNYQRICFTPIGIPDEWPKMPEKKSVDKAVIYDRF